MSLFRRPEDPAGITFMVRGEPGSGKTRFCLGAKRATSKPVAYIGNDRGAKFYRDDPDVGGFMQVETADIKLVRTAVEELKANNGENFGAVVVDTVTGVWDSEQAEYERTDDDGNKFIPMRSWRPLREGHEGMLRSLQRLPMHVFLICEEKPIYSKVGTGKKVELIEVGTKEDADKKDSYVCDVRLRFFLEKGKFKCEVLKDRTGTYPMGKVLENPKPEMWIKGAVEVPAKADPKPPEAMSQPEPVSMDEAALKASLFLERIKKIENVFEASNWKTKHRDEVNALPKKYRETVARHWQERHDELAATTPHTDNEAPIAKEG